MLVSIRWWFDLELLVTLRVLISCISVKPRIFVSALLIT